MEQPQNIGRDWKILGISDGYISASIDGKEWKFRLNRLSNSELKTVRAILLGQIHDLVIKRQTVYTYLSQVNTVLDNRNKSERKGM